MEKLINIVLTEPQRKIAKGFNFIIWLLFLLTTYSTLIKDINFDYFANENKWSNFVFSGNFVPFVSWTIIVVLIYFGIKFVLLQILSKTTFFFNLFVSLILPPEYRVPLLNTLYKKARGTSENHLKKVMEMIYGEDLESLEKSKNDIDLLAGIGIKLLILVAITLHQFHGVQFFASIMALIVISLFTLLMMIGISSNSKRIYLHKLLSEVKI